MIKPARSSLFVLVTCALLGAPTSNAAPRVLSLDAAKNPKDGCAAKVRELGAAGERVLFTAPQCPTQVLIDAAGKRVIAVEGARVRAYALADGKGSELAQLPVSEGADLWIEESGKLRASWLVTEGVEEKSVPGGAKGGAANAPAEASAARTVVRFEGKDYPVAADDAASFPPWGVPAMAILAELDVPAAGKPSWRRLEAKPTKTEAGDTPGLLALDTPRKPLKGVVAVGELVAKMTCVGGVLDCASTNAAAKKLVTKVAKDADDVGTLALDKGALLAFAVMVGDTPHAFAPVFLCTDGAERCTKSVLLEKKSAEQRQLGLAAQGGYVIVSDEYSSANARVLDAAGKLVLALPSSTAVVFLPDGVALK